MPKKKKTTLGTAQAAFLKALRNLEQTIAGMVNTASAKPRTKRKAKAKRKTRRSAV